MLTILRFLISVSGLNKHKKQHMRILKFLYVYTKFTGSDLAGPEKQHMRIQFFLYVYTKFTGSDWVGPE
jgi:hypothetical protein